jgi:hypothetical protein
MTEEKKQSLHVISITLCNAYEGLVRQGQVVFPLTDDGIDKIDSVVKTVNAEYF